MANFELVMPKLGESIIEATITKWLKKEGEQVTEDEPIAELATDKVDSEIPSPVEGTIVKLFFTEGDVVPVGKIIALINMGGETAVEVPVAETVTETKTEIKAAETRPVEVAEVQETASDRFYSPLVKSIAKKEGVKLSELDSVSGSGKDGRLTKTDMLGYLQNRSSSPAPAATVATPVKPAAPAVTSSTGDMVVEMDRMRKLIADHMVMSKQVSPHVTSFIEVDMTNIVRWRDKIKDSFFEREGQKITFTPLFVQAAATALREFPNVNASVDGYKVIRRRDVNVGMAAALPDGNLIVPVIKNADQKNLLGLTKDVNDLANRARKNKLNPDDIQGGTFTITNFGSFDSLTGTPIINQPQVAILGIGAIKKRPWVLETEHGDVIAIRHICVLSLAYDHRIVDGALGGQFLKRMQEILEGFDTSVKI